jgi:hypothetical protein
MVADNVPEIAQFLRLGNVFKYELQQAYFHVANEVEHRVLGRLQRRWDNAVDNATTEFDTSWRARARLGALSSASTAALSMHLPVNPVRACGSMQVARYFRTRVIDVCSAVLNDIDTSQHPAAPSLYKSRVLCTIGHISTPPDSAKEFDLNPFNP